jgi:hypothetical protein
MTPSEHVKQWFSVWANSPGRTVTEMDTEMRDLIVFHLETVEKARVSDGVIPMHIFESDDENAILSSALRLREKGDE